MFPGLKNTVYRVIWVGLLCLLAAGLLAACDSEPSPEGAAPAGNAPSSSGEGTGEAPATGVTTQEPEPTTDPAPSPAPSVEAVVETPTLPAPVLATIPPRSRVTPEPAPSPVDTTAASDATAGPDAGDLDGVLANAGPDTRWDELYQALSDAEQACIGNELGEEQLAAALEERVYHEGDTKEWQVSIFNCIAAEKAAAVFYAGAVGQYPELTDENKACIRQLLAGTDVPALVAATLPDTPPDQAMPLLAFSFGVLGCVPEWATTGPPVPGNDRPTGPAGPSDGPTIQDDSLLWTYATGGWVVVAPAVVDGVVYAGSDDYSVYALDAATGVLLWSYATGDVIRSTPTVADGVVYVGSNDNHLYALDPATGNLLWKYDTGDWVQYSPTVGGGMVYFGAPSDGDRKVHAVDAVSGATAWVTEPPFPIGAEVTPTVVGSRVYAAGASYGEFYALDAATGEEAWKVEVGGYVESAPMVLDGVVYLTVVNHAYALNEMTGEIIWSVNTEEFPARDFPALVVDGIYYLAPSDNVYALDAATGEELWSYDAGQLSTAPVVAEGVVYGASELAEYIFALDAVTGEELWTETTEDFKLHSLTVVDGLLYGELDSGYLFALSVADGDEVGAIEKGGFSDVKSYAVEDGVIYFGGIGTEVWAYEAPEG